MDETVALCPECGLAQTLPDPILGRIAVCNRCNAVLRRYTRDTVQQTLALTLTGLILFVIANTYPFLSLSLEGQARETLLFTGILGLFEQGMYPLAILVFLTSIAIPLVQLLGLVYLLVPILFRRGGARHSAWVFRMLGHLRPWSMTEVFMLAILVAMIKLAHMADIIAGPAIWAFVVLIFVMVAAFAGLNPEDIWTRVPGQSAKTCGKAQGPLTVCHSCGMTNRLTLGKSEGICPRCGGRLHFRKPAGIQRTWALVIAAIVFYVPANVLPVTITGMLGAKQADTIMSGVIYFMLSGSWHISLVIFVASILIPLVKLGVLIYLLVSVHFRSKWKNIDRTRLYRFTEAVGRWSMVDVYVVTVLVALVKIGSLAEIEAGPGAPYFAAVVVTTMFAAQSFDSRMIWDYED
nr:paraquat-inducible protein A [uncultured Desulfobacter sp.]